MSHLCLYFFDVKKKSAKLFKQLFYDFNEVYKYLYAINIINYSYKTFYTVLGWHLRYMIVIVDDFLVKI
jgi:hypothetical protein